MEINYAKQVSLQLGSLITLFVSIGALISLVFGIIALVYPDPLNQPWESTSAEESIRWGIALLVVFFPAYLALTRTINQSRRLAGVAYTGITKWIIYLALVIGGVVLLGDLVSVIYYFLNGDLTTRFLLKALTVLAVVGSVVAYYGYDTRGYWLTHEPQSKRSGMVAALLILVAVVVGYLNISSPTEVRDRRADEQQVNDLSYMQSYIMNHVAIEGALPASLRDLNEFDLLPTAPEGRDQYTYERVNPTTFELCATFALDSTVTSAPIGMYYGETPALKNPDDWSHKAGEWCFTRAIILGTAPITPVM